MSLSAKNLLPPTVDLKEEVGPAFVVTDNFQSASIALARNSTRWEEPTSEQNSCETKDHENPGDTIDNDRSGETAFDEAVRTKKVLRGGLRDSKWFVRDLDPVERRRARGLPGTYEEEQKRVSEAKSWRFYI